MEVFGVFAIIFIYAINLILLGSIYKKYRIHRMVMQMAIVICVFITVVGKFGVPKSDLDLLFELIITVLVASPICWFINKAIKESHK